MLPHLLHVGEEGSLPPVPPTPSELVQGRERRKITVLGLRRSLLTSVVPSKGPLRTWGEGAVDLQRSPGDLLASMRGGI